MMTGKIFMCVSQGVSASSASASSSTSVQAQIDVDEDFVADADLIAASVMGEAIPSTSHVHTITIVQVMGYLLFKLKYQMTAHWHMFPIVGTNIAVEQQVVTSMESVSIGEF